MSTTVGVLVTNYNSWDLALACMEANLRLCGSRLSQVVLVDDCSTQPAPQAVNPHVTLVRNETNLGLVKSLNKGMSLLHTDIVVIFDADARPLNDYTGDVAEAFSLDPALALLGFRTVDENGAPTASCDTEPGIASLLLGQALYAKYQKFQEKSWWVKGQSICVYTCAMALRRQTFEELGGFDEQFDWLDLDHDLSMRINRSQWKLGMATDPLVFHKGGGSPQITSHRVLRFYKNRWYLLQKFGKVKMPALVKRAILARLWTEYLFLMAASRLLFKNEMVRRDKLQGRKNIIQFCAREY